MAVPVIASTTTFADSSNTTSRTINKPSGTASGDWLVAIIAMDGLNAVTMADFTEIFQLPAQAHILAAFKRLVDGTEGANFTVGSSSETGCGVMMRITGAAAADCVDVVSVAQMLPAISGECAAPILYAESADTLIIHACGSDNGVTALTKPTADTEVVTNIGGSLTAGAQLTVSSLDQASAGYAAFAHFTSSLTSEDATVFTIAVRSTSTPAAYPAQPVMRNCSMCMRQASQVTPLEKPYGTIDGNLLIAAAVTDVASTLTPDVSFTSIEDTANGTVAYAQLYYKYASSEPASYEWANSTTASKLAVMMRMANHHASAPDAGSTANTGTTDTPTSTSFTPSADNCLILFLAGADDDDVTYNSGFPTGYTNILTMGSTQGNDATMILAFKTQTTAAATGAVTASLAAAEEWIAIAAAIAPPAGGGGGFQAAWARGSNSILHIGNG